MNHPVALAVVLVLGVSVQSLHASGPEARPSTSEESVKSLTDSSAPVRAFGAAYRSARGAARVLLTVEIEARALRVPEQPGRFTFPLDVTFTAVDPAGRSHTGTAYDGTLSLPDEARARAARSGVRVMAWLDLPAAVYDVRVTARADRLLGTAETSLVVPDFAAPLSLSGVSVLTPAAGAVLVPASEDAYLGMPDAPTAKRAFRSGDRVALFAEVYESALRLEKGAALRRASDATDRRTGDHTTHLVAELRAGDGTILLAQSGARTPHAPQEAGRHSFLASLPLEGVPPGRYVIRVRARANIGDPDSATTDIPIEIR